MARRTTIFSQIPWTGGVNTSVDSGVLPANDLVQADNVVFTNAGSRLKREGFDYFDSYVLPAVVSRSSSGTTRTLVFDDPIDADDTVHVGEHISVTGAGLASYNADLATVLSVSGSTLTYTFDGAAALTETSQTAASTLLSRAYSIIGSHDFFYFDQSANQKQQLMICVSSQGYVYSYDQAGTRSLVENNGTAIVGPITSCDLRTFSNKCHITFSGVGNTPKTYDAMSVTPNEMDDMPGAPDGEFMQEWLGRLWMNDKLDRDYLHFCETFNETLWLGHGDSGALYIGIEDGDPEGITAIAPPFKGSMFVGKGEKVVQIRGDAPENFEAVSMTNGLGMINHRSVVPRDFDDVYFMSRRGFHSILATDATGDFEGNFLSAKIQPTFNGWNKQNLKLAQATYIEPLNSVAWAVAEDGETELSALWLYNAAVNQGEWYRWPRLSPRCVSKRLASQETRIVVGTADGRVLIGQNDRYDDSGASYTYRVKSGTIYPDGNAQTVKAFKKLSLLFRQRGRFSFQAYFKVDNQPAQAMTFEQTLDGDMLAVDFVLGESILGSEVVMAPVTKDIIGWGRGCTIELAQTGADAQVEIYGIMIEYEGADIADEVKES